jgi:ESS family glutamate:Na+ symporter
MTTGMNFWDANVWSFFIAVTILLFGMIIANSLRNIIKPLRTLMIPSSVLGGFIILLVGFIYKQVTGNPMIRQHTLESLTYHGLGLGFVALSLRKIDKKKEGHSKSGGFDSGVTIVATYLLQAVLGLAVSIGLYYAMGSFFASGLLLPMGYGQGPGQAYTWGRTYENLFGFNSGTSFGLTIAAMGFVCASIGGVIYLNILRKRGKFSGDIGNFIKDDDLSAQTITGDNEIPLSESMDKFTVQVALVFIAYFLAFLFMKGINAILNTGVLGDFGFNTIQPLIWGFNFIFGTIFAMVLKAVMAALQAKKIIKREYTNNFMQNRISGFMFDLMVVASIAAIDLSAFLHSEFVIQLTLMSVLGAILTYIYLDFLCKRVFIGYEEESFLALYGMLTGTASTGIILLREMDPKFSTQAADNLVLSQPWAILFGAPMLLMLSFAPQSVSNSMITAGMLSVLFVIMNLICFRRSIFKKSKK